MHPDSPTPPTGEQIRSARESAGLAQPEAAALVYSTVRAWQAWELGYRTMHPQLWETFLVKLSRQLAEWASTEFQHKSRVGTSRSPLLKQRNAA